MEKACCVSGKISKALQTAEMIVGSLCLCALLTLMLFNAAARYLFDFPVIWSDEMNNFFFIWIGFLSCAYIMGNDGHMRVTAVLAFLPARVKYIVNTFTNLVMLVVFVYYIPSLIRLLDKVTMSGLLRIPLKYIYLVMPLSFGLMCVHIINNMLQNTLEQVKSRRQAA